MKRSSVWDGSRYEFWSYDRGASWIAWSWRAFSSSDVLTSLASPWPAWGPWAGP